MTDKYYTPSIEEFHHGFQYDFFHGGSWIHNTYSFIDGMPKDMKDARVKYLDKEDIESLGFKHVGGKMVQDIGQLFTLFNDRYYVHINYTRFSGWASIQIETSVEENSVRTLIVHSIRIKNKSELVRLMKQLNIA